MLRPSRHGLQPGSRQYRRQSDGGTERDGNQPAAGTGGRGTKVTITGLSLTGATAVKFGTVAASAFTVNSATQITTTSPAGTGVVDVTVVTPGGTSAQSSADQFSYAPAVTGIGPLLGPTTGGTKVTIAGSNLTGATAVKFGTVAASTFTVDSATQITATSPAGTGVVDVTVVAPGGPPPCRPPISSAT